ncbi:long-chain-alcohol O-fatty-acyltransferase-like [Malania oleifera]|uniref:long-chain-alcohol O-fatty-acyltransferase-like n=1 Tax=Malania oleifera TaxID=397392 RepID=UPI0025AE5732|nr:long-chain-alcohol O-fatty-acyltransferase-like [Malania oleifera]
MWSGKKAGQLKFKKKKNIQTLHLASPKQRPNPELPNAGQKPESMDGEMESFVKVWGTAITLLCYCYFVAGRIPKGHARLLSLLPVFYLFFVLPLRLSVVHLAGPTAFYLSWLANFKLLLFSFDLGPLSQSPTPIVHFIAIACLPIKTRPPKTPPFSKISNTGNHPSPDSDKDPNSSSRNGSGLALLAIKAVLLAIIVRIYDYRSHLHPYVIVAFYCCHVYLGVELTLALSAALARAVLGLEFEPQFNEPYLATSLQDFWGRRWNLMVPSILRPTVYHPVRHFSAPALGKEWAPVPAIVATFLVSGLMHEVIFYDLTRAAPTWEVTWFFVLQGVCTAAEVAAKRAVGGRWRLHRAVSGPLTVVFVGVTGRWLFLPQILRNGVDLKAIREYSVMVDFAKHKLALHTVLQ